MTFDYSLRKETLTFTHMCRKSYAGYAILYFILFIVANVTLSTIKYDKPLPVLQTGSIFMVKSIYSFFI